LDITGGDERKVGFFSGLIVSDLVAAIFWLSVFYVHDVGISVLCGGSGNSDAVVSFI